MKNFLKSRGFLVAVLTIACIGILAACWYVNRKEMAQAPIPLLLGPAPQKP